jgi:hypothetical protein
MKKIPQTLSLIVLSCIGLAATASPAPADGISGVNLVRESGNADDAWAGLSAQLKKQMPGRADARASTGLATASGKKTGASAPRDGGHAQAVSLAREFMRKFPGDPRVMKAKKIELASLLRRQRADGTKPQPMEDAEINSYIKNAALSATDRYDISALAKEARADWTKNKNADDSRKLRAGHARELVREFPDDARGYGCLLAVARSLPAESAIKAANDLLAGNAPDRIKKSAASLLSQKSMEGKKLRVSGLNLDACKGRPAIIYTWSKQRSDILQFVKRHCTLPGVALIGINLDADAGATRQFAQAARLPGKQYYDGAGLSGPLASQLCAQSVMSVYIVAADGTLIDTRGHENIGEKLKALPGKTREARQDAGNGKGGGQ